MVKNINFENYLPSSKSIVIREILLSVLINENRILRNIEFCDDVNSTINVLNKLGFSFKKKGKNLIYKKYFLKENNFNKFKKEKKIKIIEFKKELKLCVGESGLLSRILIFFIPFYLENINLKKLYSIELYAKNTLLKRKLNIDNNIRKILSEIFFDIEFKFLKSDDHFHIIFKIKNLKNSYLENYKNFNDFINFNNSINKEEKFILKNLKFNLDKTSQLLTGFLLLAPFLKFEEVEIEIFGENSILFIYLTLYLLLKKEVSISYYENICENLQTNYLILDILKLKKLFNKRKEIILLNNFFKLNQNKNSDIIKYIINDKNNNFIKLKINKYRKENFIFFEEIIERDLSLFPFIFLILYYKYYKKYKNIKYFNKDIIKKFLNEFSFFSFQPDSLFFYIFNFIKKMKNLKTRATLYIDFKYFPDSIFPVIILSILEERNLFAFGIESLKNKESNRIESIINEFKKIGLDIEYNDKEKFLSIKNQYSKFSKKLSNLNNKKIIIDSYNDHRIALTFLTLEILFNLKIKILNFNCIKKSFPSFKKLIKFLKTL